MSTVVRGRLRDGRDAPVVGERVEQLVALGPSTRVEQILSGELETPIEFEQDQDEWVVVLAGRAALDVDGEQIDLFDGEWLLLPAGVRHRLLRTSPGTSWLAVHA